MITNSKQAWTVGNSVKVGFLTLMVVAAVATPGDYAPDAYVLSSKTALYVFVPHKGLNKVSATEAAEMIAEGKRVAACFAAAAVAKASASATHASVVANLMAAA